MRTLRASTAASDRKLSDMITDIDRLRPKPAHRDKSLGAALAAALAIISATSGASDVVAAAGVIGASVIVAVAVGGRFVLRGRAVDAASTVLVSEAFNAQQLEPTSGGSDRDSDVMRLLAAHADEASDRDAGVTLSGVEVDEGGDI